MKKSVLLFFLSGLLLLSGCGGDASNVVEESTSTIEAASTSTSMPPTVTPTAIPTLTATPTPLPEMTYRISGINLGPYLYDDPNLGAAISEPDLRNLIERIAPYTYWIRTYGAANGLENAGAIAHEFGLKIAAGAWLSSDVAANEKEMAALITMAKNGEVDLAIIGNETLLRGDLTERELLIYINRFKEEVPGVPVTTADVWSELAQYPDLIASMDVVAVNMYPYWEDVAIDKGAATLEDWYLDAMDTVNAISPGKQIIIAETGWPSCGENGGPANEAFYFGSFTSFARAFDVQFFWFEAYDEQWKASYEGEVGACWGLWDSAGNLKQGMDEIFSGVVGGGSVEPALEITYIPPIGSIEDLEGYAWHVIPDKYRVVVYIYVPNANGWWIKPSFDDPLTEIEDTGSWSCPIVTGGIDDQATKVAVFLIPSDYVPPEAAGGSSLPQELYDAAVSSVEVNR